MNEVALRAGAAGAVESIHIGGEIVKRLGYELSEPTQISIEIAFWIAAALLAWAMLPYFSRMLASIANGLLEAHARATSTVFWGIRQFGGLLIRTFRRRPRS